MLVISGESDSDTTPRKSKTETRGDVDKKLKLLTDTATFDDGTVTFDVVLLEIVQELSSLTDHLLHTSAGVVVLRIASKVLGELSDSLRENGNLNFGRAGVAFVNSILFDDVLLGFLCDHGVSPFKIKYFFGVNLANGW